MLNDAVKRYGVRGLARELGVTPAYVSLIANGKRRLTPAVQARLTDLVNGQSVNKLRQGLENTGLLNMVGGTGLEPVTSAMSTRRSNQLS